jgi:hypothetical protein
VVLVAEREERMRMKEVERLPVEEARVAVREAIITTTLEAIIKI